MAEFSEFSSALEQLTEYINLQIDTTIALNTALGENTTAIKENIDKVKEEKDERQKNTEELKKNKAAITGFADSVKKAVSELAKVAEAGIKFGSTVGVSATRGVQLELSNRAAIISQIARVEADRIVSLEQQQAAQQSLTDTFIKSFFSNIFNPVNLNLNTVNLNPIIIPYR